MGTRIRRTLISLLSAFALMAGIIGTTAATSAADAPPTNVGVTMTGAFAGVTNGLDQVLSVHAYATNVGDPLAVSLRLDTGGRVDSAQAAPHPPVNCTTDGSGSTDVITCTWDGFLLSQTPQGGDFKVAVKTPAAPAASMTSTATISGTLSNLPLVDDPSDNTATVITTLSTTSPCGSTCTQGFVPQGGSISRQNADGTIRQVLSVPATANWTGGGLYVTLDEKSTAPFNCAGQPCYPSMAEALFTPFDPTAQPTAADPAIKDEVTYVIKSICNGSGNPGCFPLFYTVTDQTAGTAPQAPSCPQPGPIVFDTSSSPSIPCVTNVQKGTVGTLSAANSVTYTAAMLRDLGLPPLLPSK